jgi:hypothetical protein
MRVSKRRGMSCLGLSTVDPARHFHSELTDSAHFGERRASGTPHEQKRHSPKSRVDWSFLQIVEQSQFSNPVMPVWLLTPQNLIFGLTAFGTKKKGSWQRVHRH